MSNRRLAARAPVDLLFNKYVGGYPYLCRGINLSDTGLLAITYGEPSHAAESFSIELGLPGERSSLWLWAREVWRRGDRQAFAFVGSDTADRDRLVRFAALARGALA
jgi:hypothetical protein